MKRRTKEFVGCMRCLQGSRYRLEIHMTAAAVHTDRRSVTYMFATSSTEQFSVFIYKIRQLL